MVTPSGTILPTRIQKPFSWALVSSLMMRSLGSVVEFDDAILGLSMRPDCEGPIVVYSEIGILNCLQKSGMSQEDALEWYSYNIEQAWMGAHRPIIVSTSWI